MKIRSYITAAHEFPNDISWLGTLDIEAGAKAEGDKAETPDKFTIMANSGVPMDLEGFMDPVIIDMVGAKFDKNVKTPIIADHNTSLRIGHTTEQAILAFGSESVLGGKKIRGPVIAATGIRSSTMGIAEGIAADAKKGFPFQVSVGAKILDAYYVKAGDKANVNGKDWKGPIIVASKTKIRELSVCVLGADSNTSTLISAKVKPESRMNEELKAFIESLGLDPATVSVDVQTKLEAQRVLSLQATSSGGSGGGGGGNNNPNPPPKKIAASEQATDEEALKTRRAIYARDEARMDGIRATTTRFSHVKKIKVDGVEYTPESLKAHAITQDWSAEQVELHFRRAEVPVAGGGPAIHAVNNDVSGEALQASILRYAGTPSNGLNKSSGQKFGLEAMFKPEVLEASHGRQYQFGGSIQGLLDMQIRAAGNYYSGNNRKGSDFVALAVQSYNTIRASGFSTLNIVNVLENVMHKTSLASFEAVETTWRQITGRRPLNDFKPHALYRLDVQGSFKKVAADGELKHVSMIDSKKTIQAETYGAMICIDRKTIRDDDLGIVLDKCRSIGTLGASRIEESVYVLLLSNPGAFFHANNKNLITGGTSVLGIDGITLARAKFRNQVVNGKPVGVSPRILLVGTPLEDTATRLYNEDRFQVTTTANAGVFNNNPHKGLYAPVVAPYLSNTDITDQDGNALSGQSDTQWYLLADPNSPQGAAIVIGFLDGKDTPYFDEADTDFNVPGGIQCRSYLDWGVAMHMTELATKSAGG